jgi:hypothetical protein
VLEANINNKQQDQWETLPNGRRWRLHLNCPRATSINLAFNASFESNALISRKLGSKIQDVAKSRIFVIAQNKDIRP